MKTLWALTIVGVISGAAVPSASAAGAGTLIITSSNAANNTLLVYDTQGTLLQALPTGGNGGVGGNAGGIAASRDAVAVVNFGSGTVTIFRRGDNDLALDQELTTASDPVSVAFGKDHLYILGTTTIESHRLDAAWVDPDPDGMNELLRADGSAAQVGVVGDQLLVTEKSGAVETIGLSGGVVTGPAVAVEIPAGSDTPLGLVTRGANGYVTIAHSDQIGLVKNGQLLALTATGSGFPTGPGQQAPCWLALVGPYLFSSNSPSHTISRLIATGNSILIDVPEAAHTGGAPTDIAATADLLAVIEANGAGQSHLTQFAFADNGGLTMTATSAIAAAANGVVILDR